MKESLLQLLNSDNIEDRVLGVLMIEREGIRLGVSTNEYYEEMIEVNGFKSSVIVGYLMIVNKKMYYICFNNFIGLVKKDYQEGMIDNHVKLIYTDNSLNI